MPRALRPEGIAARSAIDQAAVGQAGRHAAKGRRMPAAAATDGPSRRKVKGRPHAAWGRGVSHTDTGPAWGR